MRDHITLMLHSGAVQRIDWVNIRPAPDARVQLTFHADSANAMLERVGAGGSVSVVCTTSCLELQRSGRTYRIAGVGIPPSQPFKVTSDSDIVVSTGSVDRNTLGVGLIVLGAVALTLGIPLAIGAASASPWQNNATLDAAAWTSNIGAGVLLAFGIVLMATGRTTVYVNGVRF
jgi:hypothetical protein